MQCTQDELDRIANAQEEGFLAFCTVLGEHGLEGDSPYFKALEQAITAAISYLDTPPCEIQPDIPWERGQPNKVKELAKLLEFTRPTIEEVPEEVKTIEEATKWIYMEWARLIMKELESV